MGKVRIPVQSVEAFAGNHTLNRCKSVKNGEIIHQNDVSQQPLAKNYCNHAPFEPKLFVIPSEHKPRAKVVQETDKKLRHAYDKPKASLKTLQFHDKTGHQVKSQRREAAVALLQVMNYYQDDATGRIGRLQENGTFRDLNLKKLAEYAGIRYKRAKRAMTDIMNSGYLKVIKQFFRDATGKVKALPSIRSFLPKFFIDLDVTLWTKWFSQREYAQERRQKKINKVDKKTARAAMGLIKEIVGNIGTAAKKGTNKILGLVSIVLSEPSQKERQREADYKQAKSRKALDLFNLDPSKSPNEYYKALIEADPFK